MADPYFVHFEARRPPKFPPMSKRRTLLWHFLAGCSVASSLYYLQWRWGSSLNPDALAFSIVVAAAETLIMLGMFLFYYDIWNEGDSQWHPPPVSRKAACLPDETGAIQVDIFLTTYDETTSFVAPSIEAAQQLQLPPNTKAEIFVLDDRDRPEMAALAARFGVRYMSRQDNIGFKAGNLRNGLFHSAGDFVVICDADTRLFPNFLQRTLGYFSDPEVAWVQTPHWFYDTPLGKHPSHWVKGRTEKLLRFMPRSWRLGADPYFCDPAVFFDVIQRRRNRNAASFCCGAGSIHRRDVIFSTALSRKATATAQMSAEMGVQPSAACPPLEPFKFHVSEDLYTSMLLHEDRKADWKSVYHPEVLARMLSPWSARAWATQRLKYAGGTYDLMLRDNPLFRNGMPWRKKLHYLATFWSYITVLWLPVLLLSPALSLVTGIAPIEAYSTSFFLHFLPMVIFAELAMAAALKGHSGRNGRVTALATMHIQIKALTQVLQGKRPHFPPTPKLPRFGEAWRYLHVNLALITLLLGAAVLGTTLTFLGSGSHSVSLLVVNLFWLGWNLTLLLQGLGVALWQPAPPCTSSARAEDPLAA